MDTFYDKEKAVGTLERLILERTAAASSPQMYNLDAESTQKFGLSISREEGDVASRLTRRNEETGETEEATFGLQGIISNVNLPPFESRHSRPDDLNRLAHARQSVVLTSLGSTVFEQIVENCRHTYSMFSRYTPNMKLLPSPEFLGNWPSARGVDQHLTITAGNRFFTPVKQSAGLELVDIDRELDPQGILAKVDPVRFRHTKDNTVEYYILTEGDDDERYTPTIPIMFQIGDIVKIQVLMTCIPHRGSFTMKLLLRTIILLDGSLTMEAITARMLIAQAAVPVARCLKRSNPYAGSLNKHKAKGHVHMARIDTQGNDEIDTPLEDDGEGQEMLAEDMLSHPLC